jgi:hypothetical protein
MSQSRRYYGIYWRVRYADQDPNPILPQRRSKEDDHVVVNLFHSRSETMSQEEVLCEGRIMLSVCAGNTVNNVAT